MSVTLEEVKKAVDESFSDMKKTHAEYIAKCEEYKNDADATKKLAKEAADKMAELQETQIALQKQYNDLDIARQKDGDREKAMQSPYERFKGIMEENTPELRRLFDINKGVGGEMVIKAPANIILGSGGAGTNYLGSTFGITGRDPETTRPARMRPRLRQIFRSIPVSDMLVYWIELVNRDGGADMVAEGALKPQLDFAYQEQTKKVEQLAVWARASRQALADISQLTADINLELSESIDLKLDQQLYDGTGVSPELRGIKLYAPTVSFTGTPLALGIQTPNRADVLMAVAAVIEDKLFEPTHMLINPLDHTMVMLDKATDGNSLNRPYMTTDGRTFIGDVEVVKTKRVPVGEFIVGDFTKATLGIREEMEIRVSENVGDDFIRNMIVFRAEMRALTYVKQNHIDAFAKGTFATAITALTKP